MTKAKKAAKPKVPKVPKREGGKGQKAKEREEKGKICHRLSGTDCPKHLLSHVLSHPSCIVTRQAVQVIRSYKLDIASSGRAMCRMTNLDPFEDHHAINKGSIRLGSETFMARMMNYGFLWTEVSCVTPATVDLVMEKHGSLDQVPGFENLSTRQQEEVREQFAQEDDEA